MTPPKQPSMPIISLYEILTPAVQYCIIEVQNGEVLNMMLVRKSGIKLTVYTLQVKPISPTMHRNASSDLCSFGTSIMSCFVPITTNKAITKLIVVRMKQRSITSHPEFVTIFAND